MESILQFFSLSKMKENLTELHIIERTTALCLSLIVIACLCLSLLVFACHCFSLLVFACVVLSLLVCSGLCWPLVAFQNLSDQENKHCTFDLSI